MSKKESHKWRKDNDGKYCEKCGSRINTKTGLAKYIERDVWGILERVNWYPRCMPLKDCLANER